MTSESSWLRFRFGEQLAVEALFQIALCSDCPGRGGEEGAAMRPQLKAGGLKRGR